MQPTIICASAAAGMVCVNGRFAGEAGPDRPLVLPVSPNGALYLEYRPLAGMGAGLARRLVLSGGRPLAQSLEAAAGLNCVAWPNGALEIEFSAAEAVREPFLLEGMPAEIARGEDTLLRMGALHAALPEGAQPPELLHLEGAAALLGGIEGGGQYLLPLSADCAAATGSAIVADVIEPMGGGLFSGFVPLGDAVGHGRLEQWLVDGAGAKRVSSQSAWSAGAPRWPQTAEATVVAAVEAMLAGLTDEATGYLSPALAAAHPLDAVAEACDLCQPMPFALPDARPCVALLKLENAHLATARPLFYRAEPAGGPQGPWQIAALWTE